MVDEVTLVQARIQLLPTRDGGRVHPVKGGVSYRPNHNFFGPENRDMAMGLIDLPAGQDLFPGQTIELTVKFVCWPWSLSELYPGREWLIQEGKRVVAVGTVLGFVD